jgi:hypothetical protein
LFLGAQQNKETFKPQVLHWITSAKQICWQARKVIHAPHQIKSWEWESRDLCVHHQIKVRRESIKFWKKTSKTKHSSNGVKKMRQETGPPVTSFHTKEALRGRPKRNPKGHES